MSRTELKEKAKSQIKGNIGILFGCALVVNLISGVLAYIPIVGYIASLVITPVMLLGITMIYLSLIDGKSPDLGDIFQGFKYFDKAFLLQLLMGLFIFLWSLLFIIPGIIKSISYSMSFYILAEDPDISALEALNESKRLMDGHKMDFFVLLLSFIGWWLLCIVTFGIAAIYAAPYISATIANFYKSLKPEINAN